MNRTRWTFVAIVIFALLIVGASLLWRALSRNPAGELTVERPEVISVRVLTALPVEPWVRGAAEEFNSADPQVDGVPVQVEIVA
ncbi:MAG: hypothetical protein PVG71_00325, partial [Anaerolineae bacterium]